MKAFIKSFLFMGVAFGGAMGLGAGVLLGVSRGFSQGVQYGLMAGGVSGLLFGLVMASFMANQRRRSSFVHAEFTDERLLHDGPANHFQNGEGVGGWLYLTERRLLFRSHSFNIQCHELSVPLIEIESVHPCRTARIIPNGLRLVTRLGQDERFVVEAHKKWRDKIMSAKTQIA